MFLPLIAALCCVQNQDPAPGHAFGPSLILMKNGKQSGFIQQLADPLRTPELSPKVFGVAQEHWRFIWQTIAFESLIPGNREFPRFNIFSQDRQPNNDVATSVGRMLERLWEYLYTSLKLDHSSAFGDGQVMVFLCNGGTPGGEQLFGQDAVNVPVGRPPLKVNTIYLYDLPTFKGSIEMAREVAHEYGHATLTPIGGYTAPEEWANGYLGEKVYLKQAAEAMEAKRLEPADLMGATLPEIKDWLKKNVQPLVIKAAAAGPFSPGLKARDAEGMDEFIGMAMYVDTLFPQSIFGASLKAMPSINAEDYPECVTVASDNSEPYTLTIPDYLSGKTLWVPLDKGKIFGAQILKRKGTWVQIKPGIGPVKIVPPPQVD